MKKPLLLGLLALFVVSPSLASAQSDDVDAAVAWLRAEAARKANAERDSRVVLSFNYRGRTIKYAKRWRTGVINTCLDLIIKNYNATKIEIWNKPFTAGWGKFSFENGFLQQQHIAYRLQNGNGESVFCAHKNGVAWGVSNDILE